MSLRSMTGFAQVKGELAGQSEGSSGGHLTGPGSQGNGRVAFSLSLKSVNHRFLDLHFRLPSGSDSIEMQLRRLLKERIARGHVEVTLSVDRGGGETLALNRSLVSAYIAAFRAAASEFSVPAEPDLNVILRIPGRARFHRQRRGWSAGVGRDGDDWGGVGSIESDAGARGAKH